MEGFTLCTNNNSNFFLFVKKYKEDKNTHKIINMLDSRDYSDVMEWLKISLILNLYQEINLLLIIIYI